MSKSTLPYKVECKSIYAYFELIAAFDCEPLAIAFAEDRAANEPASFSFRVKKGHVLLRAFGPEGV